MFVTKRRRNDTTLILFVVVAITILVLPQLSLFSIRNAEAYSPCNCVIFRLDDVEDQGNSNIPNVALLQQFVSNNHKLSTQIVVNNFGNLGSSASVFNTIKQGYDERLFEIGIHGFNHVRHSQLTEEQQSTDFGRAKLKLKSLFNDPNLRVFTPPFNDFDSGTIKAMAENSMDIFSSSYTSERTTTNIYKQSNSFQTDNSIIQLSEVTVYDNDSEQHLKRRVYHVPFEISLFNMIEPTGTLSGQSLVDAVVSKAVTQIANTGFAVITFHPTDIAPYNSATGSWSNSVSNTKFQDLKDIITGLEARGYGFSFMSDVVPPPFSQVVPGGTRTALLTLNSITNVGWGTDITVTGKLTDSSSSAAIGNANIKFDGTGAANLTSVMTNTDGTFTVKGKAPSTVGIGWKVQAYFTGDSTYEATSSLPRTYNTNTHTVSIAIAASKSIVPWGAATSFIATMTDTTGGVVSGTPVAGKTVKLDGTGTTGIATSSQDTDSNGKVTFTGLAPATVATGWKYQAHFAGDGLYKKFDSTIKTYSTDLHKTTITLTQPSTVPWGKQVTLASALMDSSLAKQISGANITFDNNGATNVGSAQTDVNGKAIYTVTSPNSVGTFPYAAHYAGDSSLYYKADVTGTYATSKHTVSIGLAVLKSGDPPSTTSTTVTPGGSYKVQGTLLDTVASVPVASKTITFTADPPVIISSKTTNTNGFYSGTQTAPTTFGTYNIQSHFAGDVLYNVKDSLTRTLTVSGLQKTTLILTKPSAVPWGKVVSLSAILQDSSGQAIPGATITFDNNGATNVGSAQTDVNGKAIYTVTSPNSVGTFPYAAHYAGDSSLYSSVDATESYSTIKHAVTLGLAVTKTGDPAGTTSTTVEAGASYKVSGTLSDASVSAPVASKTITFTADPPVIISSKTTNTNGFYSGTQTAPTTFGTYNIQSHFAGDVLYNVKDSLTRTLTVSGGTSTATASSSNTVESSSALTSITEPDENLPPVAVTQQVTGVKNSNVLVTLNGEDANGEQIRFSIVSHPSHGRLVSIDSLTGKIIYKPDSDFNGVDAFSYKVTDQKGLSSDIASILVQLVTPDSIANKAVDAPEIDKSTTSRNQAVDRQVSEPPVINDKPAMNNEPGNIKLRSNNHDPSANAGLHRTVYESTKHVTLKGSAKDVDHDALIYSWKQIGGDPVILRDTNTLRPTFNAPEVHGDKVLTFRLTIADSKGGQGNDAVMITVRDITKGNNPIIQDHSLGPQKQNNSLSTAYGSNNS